MISTIDLTSGFWHIPLTEEVKLKSAFVTPFRHFQFEVMPFGMVNSPATLTRLMSVVLAGCKHARAFMDDAVIFSQSWERHIEDLNGVLSREVCGSYSKALKM